MSKDILFIMGIIRFTFSFHLFLESLQIILSLSQITNISVQQGQVIEKLSNDIIVGKFVNILVGQFQTLFDKIWIFNGDLRQAIKKIGDKLFAGIFDRLFL